MRFTLEVSGKFSEARSCAELLYAPVPGGHTFREAKVYEIEYEGNAEALYKFASGVLVDGVSETARVGEDLHAGDYRVRVDMSLKPELLDLEKEYILKYYRSRAPREFSIHDLKISRRLYIQGPTESHWVTAFLRDLVNPVIHEWSVAYA